jgi:hypothetical protein
MPKQYEALRDKCAKGAAKDSDKYNQCQSKAAAIYNSLQKRQGQPLLHEQVKKEKGKR